MKGLLASGQASLLPKEFADQGWRKLVLLVVLNIVLGVLLWIAASKLLPGHIDQFMKYATPMVVFLLGIDSWFVGYNIKQHRKVDSYFAGMISKVLSDKGLLPDSNEGEQ